MSDDVTWTAAELADERAHCWFDWLELGLLTFEEFAERAYMSVDEDISEEIVTAAAALVWDEHLAEQACWTGTSDADRLQDAFDALNEAGIFARMSFECCGTCAGYRLWNEILPAQPELAGYLYFNTQTAEQILNERQVTMAYASFVRRGEPGEDEADAAVAARILATLRAYGLRANQEGDWGIRVELPDWRRRLPARTQE